MARLLKRSPAKRLKVALLLGLGLAGCAARAPSDAPATAPIPTPANSQPGTPAGFDGMLSRADVQSQGVRLLLPDRPAWRGSKDGTWVVLRHDPTRSTLRLKLWRAARLVRAAECAAQARLGFPQARPLEADEQLEQRRLDVPRGYQGELSVFVTSGGDALEGHAELFAAGIGRCFAALFATSALGAQREQAVGQRLSVIVEDVLPSLEVLAVEQRAR